MSTEPKNAWVSISVIKLYLLGEFRLLVNDKLVNTFRSDKTRALLVFLALADNRPVARHALVNLLWDGYQLESGLANLRMTLSNLRQLFAPYDLIEADRQTIKLRINSPHFWCDALAPDQLAYTARAEEFFPGGERIDSAPFQRWLTEQRTIYAQKWSAHRLPGRRAGSDLSPSIPNNLPRLLTPLIGRAGDFEALQALIADTVHPLITLVGEGGVGKTRLALSIAEATVHQGESPSYSPLTTHHLPPTPPLFPDGVWFVSLAGIVPGENLANHLAAAIGEALHFRFSGVDPLTDQLGRYLQRKRALLILDNFEELNEAATWLVALLQQTTALKLVVTSRQRLNLEAEHVFRLTGLTIPDEKVLPTLAESTLLTYSSIQLFVHRAERITGDFGLTAENRSAVAHICRFVGGLPLGIVLATTLLEHYSCGQIAALLEENYAILAATLADLPLRQRSIHAVLDGSWSLLDEAEQAVLAQCAIFRGAFSSEAALIVADASQALLARLEAKSLLRLAGLGRYELHELVRHYAAAQLRLLPALHQQAQERHTAYYLALVQQQREELHRNAQAQQLIREELENVRAAWVCALSQWNIGALLSALPALAHFYGLAGLQQEAATGLAESSVYVRSQLDITPANQPLQRLFTALLLEQAYFQLNLAHPDEAAALVAEAQGFLPGLADPELEINAYLRQGDIAWAQGDYASHRVAYERSLAQAQAHGWQQMIAHSLTNLGMNHDVQGEYSAAIRHYQAALALAQQLDHRQQINIIYNNLGVSHELLGEFSTALHYYEQTLQTSRALADQEGIGIAHLNLGILLTRLDEQKKAREALERALEVFQNGGHQRLEAKTLTVLAWLALAGENHADADAYAHRALALAQQDDFPKVVAEAWTVLGYTRLAQQRSAEALVILQAALTYWQQGGSQLRLLLTQSGLAQCLLAQNDLLGALGAVEAILPQLTRNAHPSLYTSIFLTCYRVLAAQQDPRASEVLHQGYQTLQRQAATITDPNLRASFLNRAAANALHQLAASPAVKS